MILIFIFIFLNLSLQKNCQINDAISKSKYATFTSNGNGVYLDTSELDGKNTISIYVTVNDGKFNEFLVFYGDTDIEPIIGSSVELENYKSSDSSSYTKNWVLFILLQNIIIYQNHL